VRLVAECGEGALCAAAALEQQRRCPTDLTNQERERTNLLLPGPAERNPLHRPAAAVMAGACCRCTSPLADGLLAVPALHAPPAVPDGPDSTLMLHPGQAGSGAGPGAGVLDS
jgi:hypothetical protein